MRLLRLSDCPGWVPSANDIGQLCQFCHWRGPRLQEGGGFGRRLQLRNSTDAWLDKVGQQNAKEKHDAGLSSISIFRIA